MKKEAGKKVTTDELARMMQRGFSGIKREMLSRQEFTNNAEVVAEEFRRVNAEIKDIKTALIPISSIVAEHERRIGTLESRLDPVEQKFGIVRLRR